MKTLKDHLSEILETVNHAVTGDTGASIQKSAIAAVESASYLTEALHRIAVSDFVSWDADTQEEYDKEFRPWAQKIASTALEGHADPSSDILLANRNAIIQKLKRDNSHLEDRRNQLIADKMELVKALQSLLKEHVSGTAKREAQSLVARFIRKPIGS